MDDCDRPQDDPGLLTLTEAAARSGHTRIALRQRVRRGSLPATKGNDGVVRLRTADVDGMPPPDVAGGDHDQPEVEAVGVALAVLRSTVNELRDDRDRMRTALDEARDELAAERLRAALAEERMVAATARTTVAEARLAAAEATLAEARVPLVLRVIAALRGR